MKMYGGAFPEEFIPLSKFKEIGNVKPSNPPDVDNDPVKWCYISPAQLKNRHKKLEELKSKCDDYVSKTTKKLYTKNIFYESIIKIIRENKEIAKIFKAYTYQYGGGSRHKTEEEHNTVILPIIDEYLYTGLTLEQLLRAELEYITIDDILLLKIPNIGNILPNQQFEHDKKVMEIKANILRDNYDEEKLKSIGMPEIEKWTEEHNVTLRKHIQTEIFNKLRTDTEPAISPAQFIRMGFSKKYLEQNHITEYTLTDLQKYGLSIRELENTVFPETYDKQLKQDGSIQDYDKTLKSAGFEAVNFKKAGYNLKQLIELEFTADNLKEITFTNNDFVVSNNLKADDLKAKGFDAERILHVKLTGYNYLYLIEKKFIEINEYLKSIGFTATELYVSTYNGLLKYPHIYVYHSNKPRLSNDILGILIMSKFKHKEIETISGINNNNIKSAIKHLIYWKENFSSSAKLNLTNIGFSPSELKTIGFSASELQDVGFNVDKLLNAGFSKNEIIQIKKFSAVELRKAGFSIQDFKNGNLDPRSLNPADFSLEEVINLIEIPEDIKNIPYGDKRISKTTGYHLKYLKEAGYDLIGNDAYNLKHIFESGKYVYGEIKDIIESYKTDTNPDTKEKLNKIKDLLSGLKDIIKKDDKSMCIRNWTGTTDPNCVYVKCNVKGAEPCPTNVVGQAPSL